MVDQHSKTLFHKGKAGAIYQWRVWTEGDLIFTEYGLIDGEKQVTDGKRAEPKNVGRSNATNAEQQAILEAKSMWQFKRDRKYSETVEECQQKKIRPMLALADKPGADVEVWKKHVKYQCDMQPKLDGNRCLAYWENGEIILVSRNGIKWNLPHLVEQLKRILPTDAMFDGELYTHGYSCQQMTKLIKGTERDKAKVNFWIYDVPICDGEEKPWIERREDLKRLVAEAHELMPSIFRVPTFEVTDEDDVYNCLNHFLQAKYEGGILRLLTGVYEWGYRSKSLLKVKQFDTSEFLVVGVVGGKGKNESTAKFECVTVDGKPFGVAPMGSEAERTEMLANGESYIGRMYTVKHFGYTDEGKPRFPTGVVFRAEEDLPQ